MNGENLDISQVFIAENPVSISESARLGLAKWVLAVIAVMCSGVFIAYAAWPDNTALAQVFELVKIGALPLVTLVISFYFPNSVAK